MFYGVTAQEDEIISTAISTPFSFHNGEEVLKGRSLSREGLGVHCPNQGAKAFHFNRRQKLKDCHIQIDGLTIYFCQLQVVELKELNGEYIYGLRILSILPQEQEKLDTVYESKLCELDDDCNKWTAISSS
ncbi:hypothetical protein [Hydrogenovibrio thermophilus]|jgi:hypothetical protein|uniref:PilZ domain-containing protein n=1 Tax=Hydrogenovibrio thermophilus TaxID=265883 RepID=A0A410H5M1_9GAMM|nr:hypothetical protein [Hydrogenovibrio thermophilus]QAB16186.1 hypothetical protein EPV75_11185 [Hydrogenovibrio thermophilus]